MLIGYHTDWAGNFPFLELGLRDNYTAPPPSISAFGFDYDPVFVHATGVRLWEGLAVAEDEIRSRGHRARAHGRRNTGPFFRKNTSRSSRRSRLRAPTRRQIMQHNDKPRSALGLDVGTSRICLAQQSGRGVSIRDPTERLRHHSVLEDHRETCCSKENVPHTVTGAEIVVHGNESDRFADLLNVETRRTMDKGLLNPAEPASLDMLRKIMESLLERTKERRKLCFTVPAAPLGAEENLTYHEATLRQVLERHGLPGEEHQ